MFCIIEAIENIMYGDKCMTRDPDESYYIFIMDDMFLCYFPVLAGKGFGREVIEYEFHETDFTAKDWRIIDHDPRNFLK